MDGGTRPPDSCPRRALIRSYEDLGRWFAWGVVVLLVLCPFGVWKIVELLIAL